MQEKPASLEINHLYKKTLVNEQGRYFQDFKRELTPRWFIVWSKLLAGHFAVFAISLCLIILQFIFGWSAVLLIAPGALALGFVHAYIQLFFHEAAHYNIAKNRKLNDRLANCLIGIFVGQHIDVYRQTHFKHHRSLGTPEDSETTYFDPLNIRFIVGSLMGIKVIKGLLKQKKSLPLHKKTDANKQLIYGLFLHGIILGGAILYSAWIFACAWLVGFLIAFPFFAAVRQVLEHRSFAAKSDVNYYVEPHGVTNRLFGEGPLASTLGGAGFNRHLLHHWEPKISFTQLGKLEKFLIQTQAREIIRRSQTTYIKTFIRLMRSK